MRALWLIGLIALSGCSSASDCENPSAIKTLKQLAESKLMTADSYLLPYAHTETQTALREAIYKRSLILDISTVRDRGNESNGRSCAAFVEIKSPTSNDLSAFSAEYLVENSGNQVVVSARFGPK